MKFLSNILVKAGLIVDGSTTLNTIANATTDTDKFLVSDAGVVKYRTGSEVLSDIGAQGSLTLTTTGSSGAATLVGNTLNIPQYAGTVTSVAMTVPTGLQVGGSPIISSGTLALTFQSGYSIPTNVKQGNWDDAYTWVSNFPTQTGNNGKYLTTDGNTLSWGTINISGYVPTSRSLTINGTAYDLSLDRSWSVGTITSITGGTGLTGGTITSSGTLAFDTTWGDARYQQLLTNPVTGSGTSGQVAYFNGTTSITSESNLFWDATNDRLGIRTNAPNSAFQIGSDIAGTAQTKLISVNDTTTTDFSNAAFFNSNIATTRIGFILSNSSSTNWVNNFLSILVTGASHSQNNYFTNISGKTNDAGYGMIIGQGSQTTGLLIGTYGSTPVYIGTNNSARLSIFSNGNIGINTTTDAGFRLDVNGTARVQNFATITHSKTTSQGVLEIYNTSSSTALANMLNILGPNMPSNSSQTTIYSGKALSNYNGWGASWNHIADGSLSNSASFGIFAQDNILRLWASGNATIGGLTSDGGFKLDIGGTTRIQNFTTITHSKTSSQGILEVYNNTSSNPNSNNIMILAPNMPSSSLLGIFYGGKALSAYNGFGITWNHSSDGSTSNNVSFNINSADNLIRLWGTGGVTMGGLTSSSNTKLQVGGSVTATSSLAQGVLFNNTLVAAANNDVLVGLDINPTFTNGAFTNVTNVPIRITNVRGGFMWLGSTGTGNSGTGFQAYQFTTNDNTNIGTMIVSQRNATSTATALLVQQLGTGLALNATNSSGVIASFTNLVNADLGIDLTSSVSLLRTTAGSISLGATSTEGLRMFASTRNVLIQNGGTFTDAGFRLDVNGTARVQGTATFLDGLRINGGFTSFNASTIFGSSAQSGNTFNFNTQYAGAATGATNYFNFTGTLASQTGGLFVFFNMAQTLSNANSAQTYRGFYYNPTVTGLVANTSHIAFENTSGNVLLGTTSGNVAIGTSTLGTATELTLGGSQTASSSIARGQLLNTTLVAAANNDVLVGLDINPTFTNGAFTGVTNLAIRTLSGRLSFTGAAGGGTLNLFTTNSTFLSSASNGVLTFNRNSSSGWQGIEHQVSGALMAYDAINTSGEFRRFANSGGYFQTFYSNGVEAIRLSTSQNLLIGTTTDAGFRLDVNGTARVQSFTTINAAPAVNADAALAVNATTNNSTGGQMNGINSTATVVTNTGNFSGINSTINNSSTAVSMLGFNAAVNISANTTTQARGFAVGGAVTGSGAVTTYVGYDYVDVFKSGSGAVTRQNAIRIANLTAGSTANIGILFNNSAGTAVSGTWDIYSQSGNASYLAGNLLLGTTSDIGGRLQVAGTITATSAIARGINFTNTLVAAANNDVLVGLDINPTFTNGAFTGVTNYGLRLSNSQAFFGGSGGIAMFIGESGAIRGNATTGGNLYIDASRDLTGGLFLRASTLNIPSGTSTTGLLNITATASFNNVVNVISSTIPSFRINNTTSAATWYFESHRNAPSGSLEISNSLSNPTITAFSTRNVAINSNTDAGFRLDVNGTARVQGATTISGSVNSTATNQYFNTWQGTQNVSGIAAFGTTVHTYFNPTISSSSTNLRPVALSVVPTFSGTIDTKVAVFASTSGSAAVTLGANAAFLASSSETNAVGLLSSVSGTNSSGVMISSTPTIGLNITSNPTIAIRINSVSTTGAFTPFETIQLLSGTPTASRYIVRNTTASNSTVISTFDFINSSTSSTGGALGNNAGIQLRLGISNPTFQERYTSIAAIAPNQTSLPDVVDLRFQVSNASGTTTNALYLSSQGHTLTTFDNTTGLTISGSSLTGSNAQSLVSLSQTWNTTGNPTAFLLNITNTASGATADLMDLQVGGASRFEITAAGRARLGAYGSGTITGTATYNLAVDSSGNVIEVTGGGGGGGIGGSGTTNYLPKFTASTTLGDSRFFDNGTVTFLGNGDVNGTPSTGIFSGTGGTGSNVAGAELRIRGGASTGNAAGGIISFYTSAAGTAGTTVNAAVERLRVENTGVMVSAMNNFAINIRGDASLDTNFGITWTTAVQVGGIAAIRAARRGATDAADLMFFTAPNGDIATERVRITSTGLFGINTQTVGSRLQVNGNAAIGYSASTAAPTNGLAVAGNVVFGGTASVIANYTSLTINGTSGSFTEYQQAAGNTFRVGADLSDGGFLYTQGNTAIRFGTNGSSERMRITNGGNVGIGTTTIGSKLQVNGNAAIGYSASTAAPTNGLIVAGNAYFGGQIAALTDVMQLRGTGNVIIAMQSTVNTQFSGMNLYNETGTLAGSFALGNSGTGSFSNNFFLGPRTASGNLLFVTGASGTTRMTMTNNGELQFTPAANTSVLSTTGAYSLTGANAQSLIDLAGTWNTTGNPTAIKLNITNTASGASAYLMDLQVGGTTQFRVTKDGAIRTTAPTGGTADNWRFGTKVASSVVLDDNDYLEVEVGGTLYRVALVNLA